MNKDYNELKLVHNFNKWDETKRQMEVIRAGNKLTEDEKHNIYDEYYNIRKKFNRLTPEQIFLVDWYLENNKETLFDCWFN